MGSKERKEGGHGEPFRFFRHLFACLLFLLFLILFTILVIYLVLRPTKPRFSLQDATIRQFNLSSASDYLLTSTVQVTLSSRNPNNRIGIYYDKLDIYLDYKDQQITLPTAVTSIYQGSDDVTIWSPFLYGVDVPVAPYLCVSVTQDQTAGLILLHVRVDGKLRWKVGTWISGHYHIHVNCPAFFTVDSTNGTSPVYRFQKISYCSVDV